MMVVNSEPLPMQPEMFTTLGEILVFWSRIEGAIDQDTVTMRQWPIVAQLAAVLPHTFNKKLELWRRSVRTLYRSIDEYQLFADDFMDAVQKVSKVRNHIIHGTWGLDTNERGEFIVMNYRTVKGVERYENLWVGQQLLNDLLSDVKMLDGRIMGFIVTKMWHAHAGLLEARPSPSPDHQVQQQSPATHETPQEPPPSSEE
jgi:hypothetical protein